MDKSFRSVLTLVAFISILVCALLAIALILDLAPSEELRTALSKTLQVLGVIAIASLAISFIFSLTNKS
ncbi:MAG: hypothetical protein Q8P13_04955 [bacterium]|nr:hypothetical protein [bacterium]